MNFLSKKVLDYQKKKLIEAEKNLQYYLSKKEQMEETTPDSKEIENQEKMIEIWNQNILKIKREIQKLEDKAK